MNDFIYQNEIKMIGLDLDGTALSSETGFSERTVDVFNQAIKRGIEIIIATGRAQQSLPDCIFEIKGLRYVATSNGARILDIVDNRIVYENYIAESEIETIYKVLTENDTDIEVFVDGCAYIGRREYDNVMNGIKKTRSKEYLKWSRIPVDDVYSLLLKHKSKIENINVNYMTMEEKSPMQEILKGIKNIKLTSSVPLNNEIGGATTSKGEALRFLMEKMGVKKENLMACGDNPNDIEMIKLAGLGIAMGNAEDPVKKVADYVTLPNYEDGVAYAIEKFAFK